MWCPWKLCELKFTIKYSGFKQHEFTWMGYKEVIKGNV